MSVSHEKKCRWKHLRDLESWRQGDYSLDCKDFVFLNKSNAAVREGKVRGGSGTNKTPIGVAVISQTCDLVRCPGKFPYAAVCPLVQLDRISFNNMKKGKMPSMGVIPELEHKEIAVDFSRAMSVEKELLVTWDRRSGCRSEAEQREFSRTVEIFFGRFPFPDDFVESVRKLRDDFFSRHDSKESPVGRALRSLQEIRVVVSQDSEERDRMRIAFLCILPCPQASGFQYAEDSSILASPDVPEVHMSQEQIREALLPKFEGIRWEGPYELHEDKMYIETYDGIAASEYLNSYPLDVNVMTPLI